MSTNKFNVPKELAERFDAVVDKQKAAGKKVTRTQVLVDALDRYTEKTEPQLKVQAFVRENFPADGSDVEAWYKKFIAA
jgi:metal-responsive CopG/Arc/MetJ family transcriptional regulator